MPYSNELSGMAALSICESLLLAMNDHKLLPEREIVGVLIDAALVFNLRLDPPALWSA